ncbi:MAG: cell surface protein SprA, partial [Paludibacteraceae bacterium]|nr:cell surface protein SprA [Paludibacteraceae bacterium]
LEFWLMDPFVYNDGTMKGGNLYIDLGNISEDILKDGRKSYENGLTSDGPSTQYSFTEWGKVSNKQSITYTFDSNTAARAVQDVGLNGLSTAEEKEFGKYKEFMDSYRTKLDPDALDKNLKDPFSPLNDPAGDNFHHFRGADYDAAETSILNRYKRYNGTEGNSPVVQGGEEYTTSATNNPDVEDINLDNTMTDSEKYFEYQIPLRPDEMVVGQNYIADVVTSTVTLKNGNKTTIKWYQFKVPLRDPDAYKSVGGMRSFKSIRFMRLYLTDFEEETHLRFATMELVKGEWRTYTKPLDQDYYYPSASIESSAVSIEENASKVPVNYVLPPGVTRVIDPSQQQVRQENEQSMAINVRNLYPKDARAVYKKLGGYDMRQYGRLQMFVHAEAMRDETLLEDKDVSIFIRVGSDYHNNYYEYEIPLDITAPGVYSNNNQADRKAVWPDNNKFDFPLSLFTDLKKQRNREKGSSSTSVTNLTEYASVDPEKPMNRVAVKGNPSLGEVQVIMIGVRNNSRLIQ